MHMQVAHVYTKLLLSRMQEPNPSSQAGLGWCILHSHCQQVSWSTHLRGHLLMGFVVPVGGVCLGGTLFLWRTLLLPLLNVPWYFAF